jgi:hypothetical protein
MLQTKVNAFSWIIEKAEANITDGKVKTSDKDSAVLLGLRTRQYQFQVRAILMSLMSMIKYIHI